MQPSILLQARSTKCCGRRSRYDTTCSFYMYSYIVVGIIPTAVLITGTRYFVMGIDHNNNSSTTIQQQSECIHAVVHRACYLLHFRHYYCYNNSCCCCCCCGCCFLTHRHNAVRGHRTGSDNLYSSSSVQYARIIMGLFLDETHARGAQIRYVSRTYVWLFGEESACTTGRWAFGCSDTVMVNM